MFNDPEFDRKRKEATLTLLHLLSKIIMEHPEQRFSQILQNYGFVKPNRPANPDQRIDWQNEFYTEPQEIIKRVQERLKSDT